MKFDVHALLTWIYGHILHAVWTHATLEQEHMSIVKEVAAFLSLSERGRGKSVNIKVAERRAISFPGIKQSRGLADSSRKSKALELANIRSKTSQKFNMVGQASIEGPVALAAWQR